MRQRLKHRIYIDQPLTTNTDVILNKETLHYLQNVLRLKTKQTVIVFNGDGNEYRANLVLTKKSAELVQIEHLEKQVHDQTPIHLIQAIARGDHMDFAIQKATELGVTEITPVITERTQGHQAKKWQQRWQHWQKVSISACEQSGRAYLPQLNPVIEFNQAIKTVEAEIKFICEYNPNSTFEIQKPNNIAICIGPEGGFTTEELTIASEAGFETMHLGDYILRTETAATSALTLLNYLANR